MKRRLLIVLLVIPYFIFAQTWQPAGLQIPTRWSKEVSPNNTLPEYPRPQMVRSNWQNLNGLWQYAITSKDATPLNIYDGQILVPYCIESALSGVKKSVQPDQLLWYKRTIAVNRQSSVGKKTLLHFGAVDWQATVFVNGKEVGQHTGGYQEFTFEITDALKNGDNELVVKVYDPTDQGPNPHGKQVLKPKDIWYTPTTGIWQTVWMEEVPAMYVEGLKLQPDVDKSQLQVGVLTKAQPPAYDIIAVVKQCDIVVARKKINNSDFAIDIPNPRLWSPEDPYLYNLEIQIQKDGKIIDAVTSYFGMRKVEIKKDAQGNDRIFLNNKYVFNLGVLDQGFWPDGIYTAPTDEALAYDIKAIKAMGFNTIRKHIKREPDRWYYHCDKIGMMVWQDMINPSFDLSEEAKTVFEKECEDNIKQLFNHPAITTWTLFNEKWGQYDQQRLSGWIKQLDPTRLLNGHSGEILYVNEKLRSPSPDAWVSSDLTDIHSYPDPMNSPRVNGKARVLGEFGGIGVFIPDHQWNVNSAWGYINVTPGALKGKYTVMNQHLKLLEAEGLSASIYTQPFDVEGEQNGLMTYDREVVKIPFEEMRKISALVVPTASNIPEVTAKNADLTEPTQTYASLLQQYLSGNKDAAILKRLTMVAIQNNDAAGKNRFAVEAIAAIVKPYSEEDIAFMEGCTKKVTDPGFSVLLGTEKELTGKTQRALHVKLMNIIYNDLIASYVPNAQAKPDWDEVFEKVKAYGGPGEEIFLRAKTIHTMNQQDWENYKPVAKEYLQKYGAFMKQEEKKNFEEKLLIQ